MVDTREFQPGMVVAANKTRNVLWQSGAGGFGKRTCKFPVGTVVMFVRYAGCLPQERERPPISVVFWDSTLWFANSDSLKKVDNTHESNANPWKDLPGPSDKDR